MLYQDIKTLKKQVEYVLGNYPETRNSDAELNQRVCGIFKKDPFKHSSSIERVRRKFNERGKYLPTKQEIAEKRKINIDEWRIAMGYPTRESAGSGRPNYTPPSEEVDKF